MCVCVCMCPPVGTNWTNMSKFMFARGWNGIGIWWAKRSETRSYLVLTLWKFLKYCMTNEHFFRISKCARDFYCPLRPARRRKERTWRNSKLIHRSINKLTISCIFTLFIYISRRLMSWTTITYEKDLNF